MAAALGVGSAASFSRRATCAGTVDRVITPVQAHGLWQRLDQPRIAWYEGTHQRFL
jgi:hypothetical protein